MDYDKAKTKYNTKEISEELLKKYERERRPAKISFDDETIAICVNKPSLKTIIAFPQRIYENEIRLTAWLSKEPLNISHQITFSFSYLHISEADSIGHLRPHKKGNKNFYFCKLFCQIFQTYQPYWIQFMH